MVPCHLTSSWSPRRAVATSPARNASHIRRTSSTFSCDIARRMLSGPARCTQLRKGLEGKGAGLPPRRFPLNSLRFAPPASLVLIPTSLADIVGGTPMVRFERLAPNCGAELVGKLEAFNPAGSVKDRIGVAMIDAAEAEGRIQPGRTTIVEATSGNTGIALAFVCAARGYELVLSMPQGMSRERENLLRLYGARVDITESLGGMNEAVEAAEAMAAGNPDAWRPDQFSNPANPEIHRRTTAEEIWVD